MNGTKTKLIIIILGLLSVATALFGTIGATNAFQDGRPPANELFLSPGRIRSEPRANPEPIVSRTRLVKVNLALLETAKSGDQIILNLFDDVALTAFLHRRELLNSGGYAWSGTAISQQNSSQQQPGLVTIVVGGGQIAASIATPGHNFQVRYAGDGLHAVEQIDPSVFPPEAEPIPVTGTGALPARTADDGSVIDVLIVYTPAARAAAGGTTAMENLAELSVAVTNQSYIDSGINPRLNLVHTAEIAYAEASNLSSEAANMSADIHRLREKTDGYMDRVHTLRDIYHADLVSLIVESYQYCGLGYLMSNVGPTFESSAFNVVARVCAAANYSYAHELGHNQGTGHDWYVDDSKDSPFSHNKGYVNVAGRWRTIMAYNSECVARGTSCSRLPYWSNPDQTWQNEPMGVPVGTSTACLAGDLDHPACDADNRQTLNETAATVANFRTRPVSGTIGPLASDSYVIDDDSSGQSSGNDNGRIDCGETIELSLDLLNQGTDTVAGVTAAISSGDTHIGFGSSITSTFPDVPGGVAKTADNPYVFSIGSTTPDQHKLVLELAISAANGGPWSDSFSLPVSCRPSINLSPVAFTYTLSALGPISAPITITNAGPADLNWKATPILDPAAVPGNWTVYYDWTCNGNYQQATIAYQPDFSLTTSENSSGSWEQDLRSVAWQFSNDTTYSGSMAGDVMAGTMVSTRGGAGCWYAERLMPAVPLILAGEPAWLSVDPPTGTLGINMSQIVQIEMDGSAIYSAVSPGTLIVVANDPLRPVQLLPVTAKVCCRTYLPGLEG